MSPKNTNKTNGKREKPESLRTVIAGLSINGFFDSFSLINMCMTWTIIVIKTVSHKNQFVFYILTKPVFEMLDGLLLDGFYVIIVPFIYSKANNK